MNLNERKSAGIVDRHMKVVMALSRRVVSSAPMDPVATAGRDSAELLDIQVEQLSRMVPDIPNRNRGGSVRIA